MLDIEQDLIAAAQRGSVGAFEQLITLNEKKMLGVAAGMAWSIDEAEDIYQEAMLSAYKALPNFRGESQFSTWLYRILANTAYSHKRKLKNRFNRMFAADRNDFDENLYDGSEIDSVTDEPESQLENQQLSRDIQKALASLSDKERLAFVLCHQQEFKIKEAAGVMETSDGAVKSYLFRAREKMQSQLLAYRGNK